MNLIKMFKYYLAILFVWPAKIVYLLSSVGNKQLIDADIKEMNKRKRTKKYYGLLYCYY